MAKGGSKGGGKGGKLTPLKTTQPKATLRRDNVSGVKGKTR